MLIVNCVEGHRGWSSIKYMVHLAGELFDAPVVNIAEPMNLSLVQKLDALLPRRHGTETCLVIARYPSDLRSILLIPHWKSRFRRLVAWVFDSFLIDVIPGFTRRRPVFDRIFITGEEYSTAWARTTKSPIGWLPWATDVLRLGSDASDRPFDLIRLGRQPSEWDLDEVSERACHERGLTFHGRPQQHADLIENQEKLMQIQAQAKFLLAFSNLAHRSRYTHPTREYLTARWVDGLGSGTTITGIAPKMPYLRHLLWPGATLELGTISREEGLDVVTQAVRDWRPEQAAYNYRQALEHLDWRWRFATIAEELGEFPEPLSAELDLLRQTCLAGHRSRDAQPVESDEHLV